MGILVSHLPRRPDLDRLEGMLISPLFYTMFSFLHASDLQKWEGMEPSSRAQTYLPAHEKLLS